MTVNMYIKSFHIYCKGKKVFTFLSSQKNKNVEKQNFFWRKLIAIRFYYCYYLYFLPETYHYTRLENRSMFH